MSGARATAGPWHRGGLDGRIVYDARGWPVADCTVFHGRIEPEEMAANAELICAARAQQDALGSLVDQDLSYDGTRIVIECASHADAIERVRFAREALAKGRGGA